MRRPLQNRRNAGTARSIVAVLRAYSTSSSRPARTRANWRAIVSRVPITRARWSLSTSSHSFGAKRARRSSATSDVVIVPSKSLRTASGLSIEDPLEDVPRLRQGAGAETRGGVRIPRPVEMEREHAHGLCARHVAGAGVPHKDRLLRSTSRGRERRVEDLRVRLPDADGLGGRDGVKEGRESDRVQDDPDELLVHVREETHVAVRCADPLDGGNRVREEVALLGVPLV